MQRRRFLEFAASAGVLSSPALPAAAADRTVRIVVPYAAGGPTDAMARLLQGPLQRALGATVLVENVPGAGGALGAQQVLRAPADGNTFFLGNNGPSAVTPLLQKAAAFDPLKDFQPVAMIAKATMQIAVSAQVPAADMRSFIRHVRAHPGELNYASAGIGSLGHLGSELLSKQAGLVMTHVPYKGQAPTLNALLGNEVQVLLTTPTDAMRAHIASGRIKLIAVTSEQPSPLDPGVGTVQAEVPGFVLYSWFALMAKSGTPRAALDGMRRVLADALATDEIQKRFEGLGVAVDRGGPDEVTAYIRQDLARWSTIIRERDIRAE
ncbi:tripartite tricarboxylate transporter substrate binding protein [Aquincola sp. MAHUQ-54]|uniref:Tripartite tricarboxylate transporter substrate binding protein n=1 Tax=Aquincola agrisoli TaxID=3119538 RepID=A0AAW9PX88_9BURK